MLQENGIELLITRVPATSGVEERAKVLEEKIAEVYPGREIHLIGEPIELSRNTLNLVRS